MFPSRQFRPAPRLTTLEGTMTTGAPRFVRRSLWVGVAGTLVAMVTACTGRGGGYLPPAAGFSDQASFGFTFSCQDTGGINPPPGTLKIQLDYTDHGTNPIPIGGPFSIHGTVDKIDPVVESEICSGPNPPLVKNELTFLGRYRPTSSSPPGALSGCPTKETSTSPMCRFEVNVRDNDKNHAPSAGDFFSIHLTDATPCVGAECEQLTGPVLYARAGTLGGGNITVD